MNCYLKCNATTVGALFPQSLLCFSSISFHLKLLSQHILLERTTFFFFLMPFLVSFSFAKDWLPLWIPSIFLGGSSGRGYRRPCKRLHGRGGGGQEALLCLSHIWFSCSGQMGRAARLFSTSRTEPAKRRLPYLLKTWLNISSHVKTIWQKLLYIFCTGEKKSNDNLFHMAQRPFALVYIEGGEKT